MSDVQSSRVVVSDGRVAYSELLDVGVIADWCSDDSLVAIRFERPVVVDESV